MPTIKKFVDKVKIKVPKIEDKKQKIKLTIKKVKAKKEEKEQKELYGLDLDILTDLGLQDMIDSEEDEYKTENITYEDIRNQFTTPSHVSLPNKLRNDCK